MRILNRFLIPILGATTIVATALCGRLWAGPIGPASGVSLPAQDVILNQTGAQSGKTFSVSSATVANIHTTTVTVSGLTGVVKATAGVLKGSATTTDLPEGSNQYFTTARATSAFTAVSPLQNLNGVLSIGPISLPSGSTSYIQNGTSLQVASFDVSTGTATKFTTSDLTVGTLSGVLKATAGSVGVGATTSDVPEGSREYFTNARATAAVSATAPLTNTNGVLAMPAATGSQNGYLTSGDWTTFNSKEPAVTSGTSLQYWRGDKTFQTLNTSVVPEGSNQYFTTARATSAITAVSPIVTTNGVLTLTNALPAGATSYIRNTSTLQSGATFYVSSGTVAGQLSILSLKWPNGAVQTSSSTISAGGSSGATGSLQLSDGLGTFTSAPVLVWDGSYLNTPRVHFGDPGESTTNTPSIRRNSGSFDFTNAFDPLSRFFFKTYSGDGLNISDAGETQLSSGLSGATPDASAKLQLDSTDMGFLMPRMTQTERDAIVSPATGLQVFNTTSSKVNIYTGSSWEEIATASISTNTIGANSFIWNQNTLQSGATFYVSSGTVAGTLTAGTFSGSGSSLTSLPAANLTGTVPNASIDASSITKQGNTFNAANKLVQLDGSAQLPAVSGVSLTNLNASNLASGTVGNARLDSSSVTLQGNTFNGASQLVQNDVSGHLPALNGAALTSLSAANLTGTVPNASIDGSSITKQGTLVAGTNITLTVSGSQTTLASSVGTLSGSTTAVQMVLDGGGSAIVAGSTSTLSIPFACTISSWTILAPRESGSITVGIKKATYSAFPTLTDMVGAGNAPSLSSAQKNTAAPASWTSTTLSAGDTISFVPSSASTVTWVSIMLVLIRS